MRQVSDDTAKFLLGLLSNVRISAEDPDLVKTASLIAKAKQQLNPPDQPTKTRRRPKR